MNKEKEKRLRGAKNKMKVVKDWKLIIQPRSKLHLGYS